MTVQDQSTDLVRQGQAVWTNAADSWAHTMQRMFTEAPGGVFGPFDVTRAVDSWFDLAQGMLAVNREYAKNVARAAATIASTMSEQAEQVGDAAREQAGAALNVVREQSQRAEQAQRADSERDGADREQDESNAREEIEKRFGEMTKAQLQDELAEHDLPKSGTVEELRERLIETVLQEQEAAA